MNDASRRTLLTISLGRRELRPLLAAALLLAVPYQLGSETLTLSTTYPSPSGIYNQLVTTGGGGRPTILARDGGSVGIGTTNVGANKLVVSGATALNGTATISGAATLSGGAAITGNATISGAASAGSLAVTGQAAVGSLRINNVAFPAPPTGTMVWKSMIITAGTEVDSYSAGSPYNAPANADTCDGNTTAGYSCPNGTTKTCVDVQLFSSAVAAVAATSASCVWGGWNNQAGGMSDTCNDRNYTYDYCNKTCTDVDCTDWVAGVCYNRSWRQITYTPGTAGSAAVPAKYKNVSVQCNSTTSSTVYTLQAQ